MNKIRKPTIRFFARYGALFLSLSLGLPNPAFALRISSPVDAGLEEAILARLREDRPLAAGLEEVQLRDLPVAMRGAIPKAGLSIPRSVLPENGLWIYASENRCYLCIAYNPDRKSWEILEQPLIKAFRGMEPPSNRPGPESLVGSLQNGKVVTVGYNPNKDLARDRSPYPRFFQRTQQTADNAVLDLELKETELVLRPTDREWSFPLDLHPVQVKAMVSRAGLEETVSPEDYSPSFQRVLDLLGRHRSHTLVIWRGKAGQGSFLHGSGGFQGDQARNFLKNFSELTPQDRRTGRFSVMLDDEDWSAIVEINPAAGMEELGGMEKVIDPKDVRILIAENNPRLRSLIERFVKRALKDSAIDPNQISVTDTLDGALGWVEKVDKAHVLSVITDLNLSSGLGGEGFRLIEAVKQAVPTARILMLSGAVGSQRRRIEELIREGKLNAFIEKLSVDWPDELQRELNTHIVRHLAAGLEEGARFQGEEIIRRHYEGKESPIVTIETGSSWPSGLKRWNEADFVRQLRESTTSGLVAVERSERSPRLEYIAGFLIYTLKADPADEKKIVEIEILKYDIRRISYGQGVEKTLIDFLRAHYPFAEISIVLHEEDKQRIDSMLGAGFKAVKVLQNHFGRRDGYRMVLSPAAGLEEAPVGVLQEPEWVGRIRGWIAASAYKGMITTHQTIAGRPLPPLDDVETGLARHDPKAVRHAVKAALGEVSRPLGLDSHNRNRRTIVRGILQGILDYLPADKPAAGMEENAGASAAPPEAALTGIDTEATMARLAAATTRYSGLFKQGTGELAADQLVPRLNIAQGQRATFRIDLNQLSGFEPSAIPAVGRIFYHPDVIIPTAWQNIPREPLPDALASAGEFLSQRQSGETDLVLVDPKVVGDKIGDWGAILEARKTPGILMTTAVLFALNDLKEARDLAVVLAAIRQAGGIVLRFEIEEKKDQRTLYLFA